MILVFLEHSLSKFLFLPVIACEDGKIVHVSQIVNNKISRDVRKRTVGHVRPAWFRSCAPSYDLDQPAHSRSLIRIFIMRSLDNQRCTVSSCGQRRLIRLRGCAGWFESSLGAHFRRLQRKLRQRRNEPAHDKTYKMAYCKAKTRISLGIRPVWSESSLYGRSKLKDKRRCLLQWLSPSSSRKHAYIILTPSNPTFI